MDYPDGDRRALHLDTPWDRMMREVYRVRAAEDLAFHLVSEHGFAAAIGGGMVSGAMEHAYQHACDTQPHDPLWQGWDPVTLERVLEEAES